MTFRVGNSNKDYYNALAEGDYASTVPHLRHETIRNLNAELVKAAYRAASAQIAGTVSVYNGSANLNRKNGIDKWTQRLFNKGRKGVHDDEKKTKDV